MFISYRQSDGQQIARKLARALRAHGVPVWLDETDLPPGEIDHRCEEALASGLAGGVLVITPEVSKSVVVQTIEAPRLLRLASDPRFSLAVVNDVFEPDSSRIKRDAPSELLGVADKALRQLKQFPADAAGIRGLSEWMALGRTRLARAGREQEPFAISVQSRAPASSRDKVGDLVFRTIPPSSGRLPVSDVWEDLGAFLESLPRTLRDSGVEDVLVTGGSHLSMGLALGAALPSTTPYRVRVRATNGDIWAPSAPTAPSVGERAMSVGFDLVSLLHRGRPLSVFVDFNEHPEDGAFRRHVISEHRNSRPHHIRLRAILTKETGPIAVARAAARIRSLAARQGTSAVDLYLRVPWPAAVLLGRELNTLRLRLFEWQAVGGAGQYSPVIVVASGVGSGPIQELC